MTKTRKRSKQEEIDRDITNSRTWMMLYSDLLAEVQKELEAERLRKRRMMEDVIHAEAS